jgi:Cof subfamily protein (haloacid dehalogenase superfamily)
VKVFVTDLDGTLLNSKHEISKENLAALCLAQEKGLELVIATGRTYANASVICQNANISAHIISNNGSFVHAKDGKELKSITLEKKFIQPALKWLHEHDYYYEIATNSNVYMCNNMKAKLEVDFHEAMALYPTLNIAMLEDMVEIVFSQEGLSLCNDIEDILNADLDYCKILSISFDDNKLRKGKEYFHQHDGLSLITSHQYNFELVNTDASKGIALEYLANHLNIPLDHVVAIGDNYNDLSMFDKVGFSVAMGNAAEDIKKRCKYVSLSNDQHGVAHIIHELKHLF